MKNNIEIRKNKSKIIRKNFLNGYHNYVVLRPILFRDIVMGYNNSKNGPWDYLSNARADADRRLNK